MSLEEEVVQLRAELAEARAMIAKLQVELDRLSNERSNPPPFVKPNTPKSNTQANKQSRRKRAKEQNGARRRDIPTQTIQHKLEQCPTCAYPVRLCAMLVWPLDARSLNYHLLSRWKSHSTSCSVVQELVPSLL